MTDVNPEKRELPGKTKTAPDELEESAPVEEAAVTSPTQKPGKGPWKKAFTLLGNIVFALLLISMAFLVFTMVQSRIKGGPPSVAGYQMYIVLGGSMSPTFEAGSLAFLEPVGAEEIARGDIITYSSSSAGDGLTTHRVMEVHNLDGQLSFTTRGDANEVDDPEPVLAQNLVGRVVHALPYAGFLMNFSQTKRGMILMVFVPGILIILFELRYLLYCAAEMEREKAAKQALGSGDTRA